MSNEKPEENLVVKAVINRFLELLSNDSSIPADLTRKIEDLRNNNKLAKGNHLKALLTASGVGEGSEV